MKVLTWNIAFGSGRNNGGIKQNLNWAFLKNNDQPIIRRISEFIKKQGPDVLCLQEVNLGSRKNNWFNQANEIERITGLKHAHSVSNPVIPFYLNLTNSVFTNKKIVNATPLKLPVMIFKRDANMVEFERFVLINAHLSTLINSWLSTKIKGSRPWQVNKLIDVINHGKKPVVLTGDLNCDSRSREFRKLVSQTRIREIRTGNTYTSWNPKLCLDHVLATPEIRIKQTKVLKTNLSDHLPVISELRL